MTSHLVIFAETNTEGWPLAAVLSVDWLGIVARAPLDYST